jgi:hypothetical protein
MLEDIAVRSAAGKYCTPIEAKLCDWSAKRFHPDDLRDCKFTGLSVHFQFTTAGYTHRLQPLVDMLNGVRRTADQAPLWATIVQLTTPMLGGGRCRVEAAVLSPAGQHLAVCVEVKKLLGLRTRHAGLIYEIGNNSVVGRLVQGRRSSTGWEENR